MKALVLLRRDKTGGSSRALWSASSEPMHDGQQLLASISALPPWQVLQDAFPKMDGMGAVFHAEYHHIVMQSYSPTK